MNDLETMDTDQADVESPDVATPGAESPGAESPGAEPSGAEPSAVEPSRVESSPVESSPVASSPVESSRVASPPVAAPLVAATEEDPRYALGLITLACTAAALVWIGAVALSANRGFDTSDEGYYLLSYRWWQTNYRNFTGAQYLYGPIFQALGYSIAGLREFRLFTTVAAHGVLGFTFMRWLRERRPHAPATRWWEAAGTTAIVAAAGAAYGWLPLSPGYNDVSLLGGMLAAAVVLRAATYVERGVDVPRWVPLSFGPVIVCSVFAKWTSASVSLGVVGLALLVVLAPRGRREVGRFALWTLASVLATTAFLHVFVVPLHKAVPPMMAVNKTVAAHTNSVRPLLEMYWTTGVDLLTRGAKRHALLMFAAALAAVGRGRAAQGCASLLAVAGFAHAYADLDAHHGTLGSTLGIKDYPAGLLAGVAVALVIAVAVLASEQVSVMMRAKSEGAKSEGASDVKAVAAGAGTSSLRRDGLRGLAVLTVIALAPITQALGTGNPLYYTAINGFAAWMPILIAVLTGIEAAPKVARWILTTSAAAVILLSVSVGTSGVWTYPYRTTGHDHATDVAGGVPALASLRLSPSDAAGYSRLRYTLQSYVEPPGRAIMGFDEMAGIILVLDGRPVGEAWYSASDLLRTAEGIKSVCKDGKPFWGARLPILIFRRALASTDLDAFKACGLSFHTDYRLVAPQQETMGLAVYVPVSEDLKGAR